ncbi:NF1 [Lepeophtheirus salmonis]|uniref:NF1 n=3 Tax=Lepeophtheirus salmonis TaxID=72036 RepID=A0A7R8HAJ4_LEPSM|nr:NF1 [Lepeophtheirus salmonis]CAF2967728.1 NF1 [Lepeophtheirus salmonis]
MIACEDDKSQQQLHFLQSCGFGGLWRFAGPFTKANCNAENVELFTNTLEALVETCLLLPDEIDDDNNDPTEFSDQRTNLSSSLTSISIPSPTEKSQNPL